MKRIFTLFSAILLVVALAVPAFASEYTYNDVSLPDVYSTGKSQDYYYTVTFFSNRYILWISTSIGKISYAADQSQRLNFKGSGQFWYYWVSNGEWDYKNGFSYTSTSMDDRGTVIWTNYDLYDSAGELVMGASLPVAPQCDGSTCPATDADHNNVCDDCGAVLTYNLRSTLLSYAQNLATRFDGYSYYAITEHEDGADKYWLIVSKTPMYANLADPYTALGTDMLRTAVVTMSDGTFAYQSQDPVSSWTGTLIDANHTLQNFMIPPLAEVIQGVTGEALTETLPELEQTIRIILLCGVGCLALLIVLHLFGRRSLISRG